MDWPIMAQPAIPPKNPVTILAMPCPRASRFLSLPVSVMSSIRLAVISDSISPTTISASAVGTMIRSVSKVSGMSGIKKAGSDDGSSPSSLTVRRLPRSSVTAAMVNTMMLISGAGTIVVNRGRP